MMTNSLFDSKLAKVLKEYKLSGDDFGPEKSDHNSVRKAHKMQPSTSFDTPAPKKTPLKLNPNICKVFQRYWRGQSDPLSAILSLSGDDSMNWMTVYVTPEEMQQLQSIMWDLLRSDDPEETAAAESLMYIIELSDADDDDEEYE